MEIGGSTPKRGSSGSAESDSTPMDTDGQCQAALLTYMWPGTSPDMAPFSKVTGPSSLSNPFSVSRSGMKESNEVPITVWRPSVADPGPEMRAAPLGRAWRPHDVKH